MARRPLNWDDYEQGRLARRGSTGSGSSQVHFDAPATSTDTHDLESARLLSSHDEGHHGSSQVLRHRRSSISMRITSLAEAGGPNSFASFARSWQRAAGFHEITPGRAAFAVAGDQCAVGDDSGQYASPDIRRVSSGASRAPVHRSLLRQQIEQSNSFRDEVEPCPHDAETGAVSPRSELDETHETMLPSGSPAGNLFAEASHLAAPFAPSGGGIYGSLSSRAVDTSYEHGTDLPEEQQKSGRSASSDKECEPLLLRRTEDEDGNAGFEVIGQSTIYQTVLNSTNVLVGIGLLSLPFAIKYAGWLIGMSFLLASAIVTRYTASLLGQCLDADRNIITFADLAYVAFGPRAQIIIGLLFSLELSAACVALFVLFADSLDLLVSGWSVLHFKILCGCIMLPLSFVPLRMLAYTSSLGIIACLTIVIMVVIDGLIKPDAPGSLRQPAQTYLFPEDWSTIPLSFGLLMAPWGGHAVFPNIFRDMRHTQKYDKALDITFTFTYLIDATIAAVGWIMFGDGTRDEVTSNIFLTPGYPPAISYIISCCIALIPLTKIPLNAHPIIRTAELVCGLGHSNSHSQTSLTRMSNWSRITRKIGVRVAITALITLIAVLCPSFDRVMALMGSLFCFTICVILPVAFYLRLFGAHVEPRERVLAWFLIVVCLVLAVVGTVWAFLPR